MNIRDASGTLRAVTGIAVRDAGGVLRQIQTAMARDAGGVLRVVFSGMKATISPDTQYGYVSSHGPHTIDVGPVYVGVVGGVAPYTYSWALDLGGWTALSPTAQGCIFRSGAISAGDGDSNSATCTVTDANGATAVSNMVNLVVTNLGV